MPKFDYVVVDLQGQRVSGELVAESHSQALDRLRRAGRIPLNLEESRNSFRLSGIRLFARRSRVRTRDLLRITHQLAALLRAGLTIDRALTVLGRMPQSGHVRLVLERWHNAVRQGLTFGDALQEPPSTAPDFYVALVRAAEASGALSPAMARLAGVLERSDRLRQRLRAALLYPLILLIAIGLTLALVLTVVLPRLEALFAEAGAQPPLPTRLLIGAAHVLSSYGGWAALGLCVVGALAIRAVRRPDVRYRLDGQLLTMPIIGPIVCGLEAARFLDTLGSLIGNGVPARHALPIANAVVRNRVIRDTVSRIATGVATGSSLSQLLNAASCLPALAGQLAQIGEETGRMDTMLIEAAEILDQEAASQLEQLLTLLLPAMIIVLGLIVAGLVGSVMVGLLGVNDLVG